MGFDPSKPYNDLPDLPPSVDIETKTILKACVKARAALAARRQAMALIPNPAVLINTIQLLEAYIPHIAAMIWRKFPAMSDQPTKALAGTPSRSRVWS